MGDRGGGAGLDPKPSQVGEKDKKKKENKFSLQKGRFPSLNSNRCIFPSFNTSIKQLYREKICAKNKTLG